MFKRLLLLLLLFVGVAMIAVLGVYSLTDVRMSLDGTGRWPRIRRAPDFSALEADRARQREQAGAVPEQSSSPGPPGLTSAPGDATGGGAGASGGATAQAGAAGAAAESAGRGYLPDFRGSNRDGKYTEAPIRTDWPKGGLPRLWRQPIGLGYASFVAAGGRAFTIEQRRGKEVVAAYDVESGRELWTNDWDAAFAESLGGDGPRATPTYHEGRVYALGATGELRCLDARAGTLIWRRDILADARAENLTWGMSASPLIVDNNVIVLPGGPNGRSVAAYEKSTGQPVWQALDDQAGYTSPVVVTLGGVRQLLVVTASRAVGLSPDNGMLLWDFGWETTQGINVAQPLMLGDDRVFLSAGYGHGAAVVEVIRDGDRLAARQIWQNNRMKNKFTSSVLHRGYIYGLDEAILACMDAATGALKWKGGRYGFGQVLLAGDHIVVLTEDGDVVLVEANPERHVELAKFAAIEGKTWNHPVIVDGRLLVRNLQEMAAFDIRPSAR